jgi:hypothetical protein
MTAAIAMPPEKPRIVAKHHRIQNFGTIDVDIEHPSSSCALLSS